MACMEVLMSTLRKDVVDKVTCLELKSHPFKALELSTFMYGSESWERDLQNFSLEDF